MTVDTRGTGGAGAGDDRDRRSLIGRTRELDSLRAFARRATLTGGALVISGDAGVGKSALLDVIAEYAGATGTVVLRAAGSEQEGRLSYAALNQLLFPLAGRFAGLGSAQRQALEVALGFGHGAPPKRLLVSNAVAVLLRKVAAESPLLLVVDDLHWVDRASANVLSFVARRLGGSRAGLLAAARTGVDQGYFERAGLLHYPLGPLPDGAADGLLDERFPDLDPAVRVRVLTAAQGNPLALLELPRALSQPQRTAAEPLPAELPLGERLQKVFAARVATLPHTTRALLLTAALSGTGELTTLEAASSGVYRIHDLTPAERERLIEVHHHQVVFRHPLIRAAVVETAPAADRRRVHETLAAVFADQPDRRAWHLGEAAVEPDERVAAALESASQQALTRGDYQTVVALLTRAADLSPDSAERGRRLATAAYIGAEAIGEISNAAELLARSRRASRTASASLHYASAAALVMLDDDGNLDTIHHLLASAIENSPQRHDPNDPEIVSALWMLALLSFIGGRESLWQQVHAAIDRLEESPPDQLLLTVAMFADPVRTALAAMPRLDAELRALRAETDTETVFNLAAATMYVDRLGQVREHLWPSVLQGRQGGPARRHIVALMDICVDDFHRGDWKEASELAAEGANVTEQRAGRFFWWYFAYHRGLLAAVRGEFDTSRAVAEQMLGWAGPRGVGTAQVFAHHCLVLASLGSGDFEGAYQQAIEISPAGTLASHVPHCLWVAMDLVEAAVRTGRLAEAERHVRALQQSGVGNLSPRLAILVAGSAAMATSRQDASALFQHALGLPGAEHWPFDVARVRLAFGEHLRRSRAIGEARTQLRAALDTFRVLGAEPWAQRAERELRAAGEASAPASSRSIGLTAQELQIARLAASGLTNKEIAARLFLSPRTVGGHLHRAYPKLGITTRAALRDALDERL